MAFIAGKGFAILNSKAEKGDQKAKDLLAKLDSIDQDEADRLFSEILGKGGGGGSKSKKTKAPGASATDGQGEITEGDGEQAPTGKAKPKAKGEAKVAAPEQPTGEVKPKGKDYQLEIDDLSDKLSEVRQGRMDGDVDEIRARIKELKGKKKAQGKAETTGKVTPKAEAPANDPLSNDNLQTLFDSGLDTDGVIDELRKQTSGLEADPESPLAGGDIQGIVEAFETGYVPGGKKPEQSNLKFKSKKKENEFNEYVQEIVDEEIEIDDLEIKQVAADYGLDPKQVEQYIRGKEQGVRDQTENQRQATLNQRKQSPDFDVNKEVAQRLYELDDEVFGIEEDEYQQVAQEYGVSVEEAKSIFENDKKETEKRGQENSLKRLQELQSKTELTELEQFQLNNLQRWKENVYDQEPAQQISVNDQSKQQARQRIDDIMQEGRGGVSLEEAEALSEEFGIPVEGIRALETQSQIEIPFPAPDQGEAIPADQDFDEQGNPIGNINDKEVADELGVNEQELAGLLGPNPLKTLGKTYQGAPWEEENIKNILQQAGGDKAKALELLKQQQAAYADKGPILKDQFLPGLIEQAAAGETNLSLPASEPTAEQLAETDSLFENTPEKEMVAAEQLAGQGDAPLSQLTDKIQTKNILSSNESSIEGTLPNGSQFIVTDTGTGLQYQIVNGPDGDEEPLNVGYDEFDTLVDFINNDGKESGQPATFEVADENNLTPDEFQRMDFEAGEADNVELERVGSQGFEKLSNEINFDRSVITNDQIQQVAQELGLEGKTPEQLQQIRNGVVKQWETTTDRRRNKSVALSAITAAIDSYIMGGNRNKPAAEPAGQGQQTKDKDTGNINGKQYSVELVNGKPVSGVIDGKGFSIDDDGVVTTRGGRGSKDFYETVTSLKRMYQEGLQPREEAAKPAQSQEQIKQTAQANAQQAAPAAPATAAAQPQTQPGKIDRKKLEQAAGDLGVNADLLEGLLELLKKVR
jgi:hypothetical protein